MPVEDNADFRLPLTASMVDKMHKQADQYEKDAERMERAQQKFTNMLGTHAQGMGYQKGYNPKDPSVYDPSTAAAGATGKIAHVMKGGMKPSMGETGSPQGAGDPESANITSARRVGAGVGASGLQKMTPQSIRAFQAAALQDQKAMMAKIKEHEMKIREHEQHIQNIHNNISKGFGKVQEGFSFAANPVKFGMTQGLKMLGKASAIGAIAAMVIEQVQSVYQQVIEQIKDMYAPGGILDVRKEQLDSLRQVGTLSSLIDMEQGRVFFTSNTGELLRQGVPQATNTEGRVNGYKQYLQEYER
jgi:hypothetical protein